ncbi:MAG: DMT family transporter [Pseudomonadota bacterium]
MATQMTMGPRAWGELLLLSLIWGGTFLSVRVALDTIGPLTVVAHRVGWACLLLWAVVAVLRLPLPLSARLLVSFLGMGLLNNAVPFTLQAWAQLHVESGLVAILNAGTAFWGVLVAALFLADERLSGRKLLGVTLGFFGVATAIGIGTLATLDLTSLGQIAVVASTLSYAMAGVWARWFLKGLHPLVQAAGMLTASTLVMVPLAWGVEGPLSLALGGETWAAIAYVTVIATAAAYLLYYRVLAMAGSGNLMICTLLIAPIAIVLGAVFLAETLAPRAFVGFAILAAGLLILAGKTPFPARGSSLRQRD